jgi:hypothetical protein
MCASTFQRIDKTGYEQSLITDYPSGPHKEHNASCSIYTWRGLSMRPPASKLDLVGHLPFPDAVLKSHKNRADKRLFESLSSVFQGFFKGNQDLPRPLLDLPPRPSPALLTGCAVRAMRVCARGSGRRNTAHPFAAGRYRANPYEIGRYGTLACFPVRQFIWSSGSPDSLRVPRPWLRPRGLAADSELDRRSEKRGAPSLSKSRKWRLRNLFYGPDKIKLSK